MFRSLRNTQVLDGEPITILTKQQYSAIPMIPDYLYLDHRIFFSRKVFATHFGECGAHKVFESIDNKAFNISFHGKFNATSKFENGFQRLR